MKLTQLDPVVLMTIGPGVTVAVNARSISGFGSSTEKTATPEVSVVSAPRGVISVKIPSDWIVTEASLIATPLESFTVIVTLVAATPSATTDVGPATMVDVASDGGPAVKEMDPAANAGAAPKLRTPPETTINTAVPTATSRLKRRFTVLSFVTAEELPDDVKLNLPGVNR